MIGGHRGFVVITTNLPLPIAVAAGMAGAAVISGVIEKIGYEPLRDAPVVTPMLSTLGFSIILQNVATNVWGSDPLQLPDEFLGGRITLGPVSIGELQLIVIGVTIALVAIMAYIVQRTSVGRALRAVAENREVARLLGVSSGRITLTAFMMSVALAGAAGGLNAIHYAAITPYVCVELGLKAIAVIVIGATSRICGQLLAGLVISLSGVLTAPHGWL